MTLALRRIFLTSFLITTLGVFVTFSALPVLAQQSNDVPVQHGGDNFGGDIGGIDRAGSQSPRSSSGGFGDDIGVGFPAPDAGERDLSAWFGSQLNDEIGVIDDEKIKAEREGVEQVFTQQDAQQAAVNLAHDKNLAEGRKLQTEKVERKIQADLESRERLRNNTRLRYNLYLRVAEKDGVTTDEEQAELDRRYAEWMNAEQFTPAEELEIERYNQVRGKVSDEIGRIASTLGGTSQEEIEARRQNANLGDSSTKTWRSALFTGKMANEVQEDVFNQRELGIRSNNRYQAAQIYMNQTGHTEEELKIAEEIGQTAYHTMGKAGHAIALDGSLVLMGAAADVAVLGAGRPVSLGAGKFTGWVRGLFQGAPKAAPTVGAEVGAAAGGELGAQTGRTAGTEAGAVASGEVAGNTTQVLTKGEQVAVNQALNDARAGQAAGQAWRSGAELADGGASTVIGAEAAGGTTAGAVATTSEHWAQQAAKLSLDEINALFKPGVNLTGEQIAIKAELLAQGFRAPGAGGFIPAPAGVVPGAASEGATLILPGQAAGAAAPGAAVGVGSEAGTIITRGAAPAASSGSAVAGNTTQAFNGAVTLPPPGGAVSAPTLIEGGATGATTIIERGGAASFRSAPTVVETGANTAAGSATQTFNGAITLPPPAGGAATAPTLIQGTSSGPATTIIQQAGQKVGAPTAAQVESAEAGLKSLQQIADEPL